MGLVGELRVTGRTTVTDASAEVAESLKPMFAEAREKGLWFWCHYQDLWFSPDALEAEQRAGRFRWGAVNWRLRDPKERPIEADKRVADAVAERERIAAQL